MTEAIPMTTTTAAAATVNSESPPPPPPRRRDRDRRDDRDSDRRRDHHRSSPPLREREYKRRLSPSPPPPYRDRRGRSPPPSFKRSRRDEGGYDDRRGSPRGGGYGRGERRERDYKRRFSPSSPPPYRDRRGRSPPPSFKRSRRDEGGYDDRRGSSRGVGYGHGERRFGYGQYDRDQGGRGGYGDERSHGRYGGRSGGYQNWGGRGGYDAPNAGNSQREGLMSYKQFIQELEDDVLPSEAERRYQEYKSEFISTQKRAFFDAHKDEEWLKDKYHPTNLVSVIERRNELAQKNAKDFLLDLQSGTLDLGPGLNNPSGSPNSDEDADVNNKKRRHGRSHANLSGAPKAHPVSSEPRRIQIDIEQSQALVRKLDSEKGVEDNILSRSDNDRSSRDKAHGSSGPVVIVRGLASVKGLEGVELLDTLITYLWRIHGVDYYGLIESGEPKGLRHVRIEGKSNDGAINGAEWEKKLDTRWEERLRGQDPLEVMSAKEKLDSAAVEALDPNVRKIRDEKYGWKYGCGAKGCTKLFHAAEFVHKHLKLKHPELVIELTSKVREDLYFQNYMDDVDAPGGTPVMQPSIPKERPLRRRPMENRLKDDRRIRDDRDNDRTDKSHNMNDGTAGGNGDDLMYDSFGQQGLQPFPSDMAPPPVLMPVPGAGPLGPFVPAPPEVAMRMMREQGGGPSPFDGSGRNGRAGQQPLIALPQGFRQDPRRLRSYNDLDAPDEEVTVIDYRSL